jgi:hexosaminidase
MMGGGGEQWGETVDTSDLEQTVWPRLGAIGERWAAPLAALLVWAPLVVLL